MKSIECCKCFHIGRKFICVKCNHHICLDCKEVTTSNKISKRIYKNLPIPNPEGRVDILISRIAERVIRNLEKSTGLHGLNTNLSGLIQESIKENFPKRMPRELMGILKANLGGG